MIRVRKLESESLESLLEIFMKVTFVIQVLKFYLLPFYSLLHLQNSLENFLSFHSWIYLLRKFTFTEFSFSDWTWIFLHDVNHFYLISANISTFLFYSSFTIIDNQNFIHNNNHHRLDNNNKKFLQVGWQ